MGLFKRVLKASCEGSSMKALPRIMRAPTSFQRMLWILGLLGGLVVAAYQLVKLLMGYLEFETSVNIVEIQGSPPFPDVTMCHLDPSWTLRILKQELHEELSMAHYEARVEKLMSQYTSDAKAYKYLSYIKSFPGYLQNVPRIHTEVEELRDIFIIDCAAMYDWDPIKCFDDEKHMLNTSVFLDPVFGLCVTFKIHDQMVKGLNVIFYLDDPENLDPMEFDLLDSSLTHTSKVGVQVVIHPKGSFPDIWLASQHVHAGTDVAFSIKGTERTVLDEPYGACISAEEAEFAKESGEPGYAINRHGYECYRMCAKDVIVKECQCLHVYYASSKEERANMQMCGFIDDLNISSTMAHMTCAESTTEDLAIGFQEKCGCPVPCEQFVYEYTTKSIGWPHDNYHLSFYDKYIRPAKFHNKFKVYDELLNMSRNEANKSEAQAKVMNMDLIKRNFAQVRIQNHQKTYLHYSETPLISPEALFGNVGGLLNLWVGITFITIIEIFEFMHQLLTQKNTDSKRTHNGTGQHPPDTTDGLLRTT